MPNNLPQDVSFVGTIVSVVSAVTAIVSSSIAFRTYQRSSAQFEKSQKENKKNQKEKFIIQSNENLDRIYIHLSEFIQNYTTSQETTEKRGVRDRILYSLESLRVYLSSSDLTDNQIVTLFGDISVKISDITFEDNFEKNMYDLAIIKNKISDIKSKFFDLG